MEKKPFDINRNIYKSIKNMNREQLSSILSDVYETGRRDYDLDELREVIGAVSGIGETRLAQIIDAIREHYRISDEEDME